MLYTFFDITLLYRSAECMEDVYRKTLTKLFNGAKNVTNNNFRSQCEELSATQGENPRNNQSELQEHR